MTTFTATKTSVAPSRVPVIHTEVAVPWRLLAAGICLFGSADIVGMEGFSGASTGMFFAAYTSFAASLTMFINKSGR